MVLAGTRICLHSGESLTLAPYLYHDFYVEATGGAVLLGEDSMYNDDVNDNCFLEKQTDFRRPGNEPPYRLYHVV